MALAARLLPQLWHSRSLPCGAVRLRTPAAAEMRLPSARLCYLCRCRLGLGAALFPRSACGLGSSAYPAQAFASFPACPQTRIKAFLIWAYFDKEFSIAEFSEGAKQAFAHVSKLLSQCKFDLLEELVAKEVLHVLKEKVTSLPDNHKNALAANIDEIVFTSTGDISIYYDEKGRKFVNILMCFWYLTSANIPSETLRGASIFQVKLGNQNVETKQLLSASYEFQREFTQGVKPDWTIARIEHSKLLE
uniref:Matrix AAA peptidase interacting protein 1 n=1 Tax=Rhinopithecus bieti TaxID=61621 RepID=A0A2K6JSK2_RHIBE